MKETHSTLYNGSQTTGNCPAKGSHIHVPGTSPAIGAYTVPLALNIEDRPVSDIPSHVHMVQRRTYIPGQSPYIARGIHEEIAEQDYDRRPDGRPD